MTPDAVPILFTVTVKLKRTAPDAYFHLKAGVTPPKPPDAGVTEVEKTIQSDSHPFHAVPLYLYVMPSAGQNAFWFVTPANVLNSANVGDVIFNGPNVDGRAITTVHAAAFVTVAGTFTVVYK